MAQMRFKSLGYVLIAMVITSCQGGGGNTVGTVTASSGAGGSIIGGDLAIDDAGLDDPSRNTTGFLSIDRQISYQLLGSPYTQEDKVTCTGVLIEPDILLTAAHCVIDSSMLDAFHSGQGLIQGDVFFPQAQQRRNLQKAVFHSQFGEKETFDEAGDSVAVTENDLAVILLDSPVAPPLRPANLPTFTWNEDLKVQTRVYGFGLTSSQGPDDVSADPQLRFVDLQGRYSILAKKLYFNQAAGRGVCYGDSGGPHFNKANPLEMELVGISSSLVDRSSTTLDACLTKSEAMAVADYLPWIQAAKVKLRGPDPAASVLTQ